MMILYGGHVYPDSEIGVGRPPQPVVRRSPDPALLLTEGLRFNPTNSNPPSQTALATVDENHETEQNTGVTAKAERMKSELAGLTPEDRAELVRFLIESLDGDEEQGVAAAWDAELKRRAEDIESGRVVGEPAEKLLREMRAKYS